MKGRGGRGHGQGGKKGRQGEGKKMGDGESCAMDVGGIDAPATL